MIKKSNLGRGIILHIAPSNVPMIFAISCFWIAIRNSNVVRLPSRKFIQIKIFYEIKKKIIQIKKYQNFKKKILLVNYSKSNIISSELSKYVDARIIWGGDETVMQFKKFETLPRCIDVNFPNRYSISLLKTAAIKRLKALNKAIKFEIF